MCSVLGMYDPNAAMEDSREELMRELSARMRTRGPDGSGYYGSKRYGLAHERLAIIDPESGAQPLFAAECKDSTGKILIEEGSIIVAANGEIYNYKELYDLLKKEGVPYEPNTGSDCEVLIPLYVKFGLEKACSLLRGADPRGNQIYATSAP